MSWNGLPEPRHIPRGESSNAGIHARAIAVCAVVLLLSPNLALRGKQAVEDAFSVFEKPTRMTRVASGSTIAAYCIGQGRPTVVLESGAGGNTAASWYHVVPLIARRTRVCAYDRAGFGFSRLGTDLPRDLNHDLDDLHEMLRAGPGSLEVDAIKNYGAIEVGSHRFCHEENGRTECGTFKFVHVWRKAGKSWRLARIVSYAH